MIGSGPTKRLPLCLFAAWILFSLPLLRHPPSPTKPLLCLIHQLEISGVPSLVLSVDLFILLKPSLLASLRPGHSLFPISEKAATGY
ncbi:hypothetical protein BJY04DRAFT_184639 [Aspergillus karnatakaensis]|uniref:uncharacterized protein n=1 Tax=Aspergillus karnatakaensis TaxID=1810916 RepID=UPI003CCD0F6A